ncbi:MAG: DUF1934 domain-containing protein [Lachnospiraceae bacterium]|nr:DUF1934 domain-containing protein [Lachnospiraceae bacterium]
MPEYNIRITTTQFDVSEEPVVEEASAKLRIIDDIRYINYVLSVNDDTPAVSTLIEIKEKSLRIFRMGGISGRVIYSLGEAASSQLDLGFMCLDITNKTDHLAIFEIDGNLAVNIRYKLYINDAFVSDCETDLVLTRLTM